MQNRGFLPDLHELISGYPWLTKRVARMLSPGTKMPGRNPLSYLFALFVPYGGRAAGGFASIIVVVAVIGILAAIALPAYQKATGAGAGAGAGGLSGMLMQGMQEKRGKEAFSKAWQEATSARQQLGRYYEQKEEVPDSLAQAGVSAAAAGSLRYDSSDMSLTASTPLGALKMVPTDDEGTVVWHCSASGQAERYLPEVCREKD